MSAAPITPDWVRMMAGYNAWQNGWMAEAMAGLPEGEAKRDRGAFFGSILGTANHVLWGDRVWMSRLSDGAMPEIYTDGGTGMTANVGEWASARRETDAAIRAWAEAMTDCTGEVAWWSGVLGREVTKPKPVLYTHFFNHQTHHRGQNHAMLTAAGAATEATDLIFMPEDA
ncbi:DinB family protein [Jannaschia ovalis]|uniref:DinB family protein n=1 Tax=Jannaschia ovalis TaxID=3038773 RepID=A0ABY8LAR7_9RHOB|nr:DinB family protein [Jannaschia sp. GRR-S6-38]WGH78427.1 DinB family protein [Jannaschia sp. GRR-S6-38]